jgi:hypothetical protein
MRKCERQPWPEMSARARWIMPLSGMLLALLAVAYVASSGRASLRLQGLDRMYFSRAAAPGGSLSGAPQTARMLLPETLEKPQYVSTDSKPVDSEGLVFARDLEFPLGSPGHRVWIREVIDSHHPRISELWWALYDQGRRSDVWYFTVDPDQADGKVLSNYRLEDISLLAKDRVVFRVRGEMFRPAGAWWIVGKEFIFHADDRVIDLVQVQNTFGFFHSYDIGDSGAVLSVSTEREVNGRLEERSMGVVSGTGARACGFRDPQEDRTPSWRELLRVAQCITGHRDVKVAYRSLSSRSFVERGESPPKKSSR